MNIHRAEKATPDDEWGVVPTPGFEIAMTPEQTFEVLRYRNYRDRVNIGGNVDQKLDKVSDVQLQKAVEYLKSFKQKK